MLKLTQIELLGFKSFPHKTVLDIDSGITCIVGPNGSGKSNLADAINFAFGSQSGRELRAHRLAGLIFAGTEQLRPLNLASVTLHFERTAADLAPVEDTLAGLDALAEDELVLPELATASQPVGSQLLGRGGYPGTKLTRHLSAAVAKDYDRTPKIIKELTELEPSQRLSITRRVFRDGTGGYYLNDQLVRLKDIDALFNRFNLGRSAVFSINQGEVEQKVLNSPQQLREWLAEATGVALLLQQKQRAQNKLKRTRQNLERLEDIRSATRELVEDLAGQRERAEQHLRLRDELRAVELNEIKREVEFAQKQQESAAGGLTELNKHLESLRAEYSTKKAQLAADEQARARADTELERGEGELSEQRERLAKLRQDAAVARRAIRAAEEALEQIKGDISDLDQQLVTAAADLKQNEDQSVAQKADLEQERNEENKLQQALLDAHRQAQDITARKAEAANYSFELASQEVELKNRLETLKQSSEQLGKQLTLRREQQRQAQERCTAQAQELDAHRVQAENLALTVGNQRDELAKLEQELTGLSKAIEEGEAAAAGFRDKLAELTSRRRTIAELAVEGESDASCGLLADENLAGQLKLITEITFPAELRPAFTRLLAHLGDALTGDPGLRNQVRDALSGAGNETLLLYGAGHRKLHPDSLWLKLACEPSLLDALIAILGDVVAATDLNAADALLVEHPELSAVVLTDGSALVGRGYAYLGMPSPERALKVARLSDLVELDRQIEGVKQELAKTAERVKELRGQRTQRQWERDEASSALAAAEERLRHALELSDRLHAAVDERNSELELYQHQAAQLDKDREQVEADQPVISTELEAIAEKLNQVRATRDELTQARDNAETKLEVARSDCAKAVTRRELAEQHLEHLKQTGFDLAERVANLRMRHQHADERRVSLEQGIAGNVTAAQDADTQAAGLEQQLSSTGDTLAGLRQRRTELNAALGEQQQAISELVAQLSRQEQDEVALSAQRERAVERVSEWLAILEERYSLTLSQLLSDPHITAPPPGAVIDASEVGRGKLRDEKARLSAGLAEIGDVNLLAIEQHQQHSQRLAFLDGQADELMRAAADLDALVGDLDQTTEKRYRDNLRRIEQRFNEIFLDLFGSGWARLHFEDPEAIIDSGVEVQVQLPAARRHSLRSLSGGQRSLIFLALFFAVHSVRSPGFCILDEADAALDDANVERFQKLIRRGAGEEQFIIITHNKRTMETADKLVGVVGKPKGISNLLSVDIKQARKMVERVGA